MNDAKLKSARDIISRWLERGQRPVVTWSSGKDSMVLLALVREVAPDLPVMFLRQSDQGEKYTFADRIIAEWGLSVVSAQPLYRDAVSRDGKIEIVEAFPAGLNGCFYLPLEGERELDTARPFICGFDRLSDPVATANEYEFDVTFIGHKGDDHDPMHGAITPRGESAIVGATVLVYPLWNWTAADVWDATAEFSIPQNEARYDIEARTERSETSANNDYHNLCARCLTPGHDRRLISCPKTGRDTWYLGDLIPSEQRRAFWREQFVNIAPAREE